MQVTSITNIPLEIAETKSSESNASMSSSSVSSTETTASEVPMQTGGSNSTPSTVSSLASNATTTQATKTLAARECEIKKNAEQLKHVKRLNFDQLNTYFKQYHIDIFTHLQNLKVKDVIEIAIIDLVSSVLMLVNEKIEKEPEGSKPNVTNVGYALLNCIRILQLSKNQNRMLFEQYTFFHASKLSKQVTTSLNEELNTLLKFLRQQDQNYFLKHLHVMNNLGDLQNCDVRIYEFARVKDNKDLQSVNEVFLTNFSAKVIKTNSVVNIIYCAMSSSSWAVKDEISKIIGNLKKFCRPSVEMVTIELGPGQLVDLKKPNVSDVKTLIPLFEKLKNVFLAQAQMLSSAKEQACYLRTNASETCSQTLMEFYKMNAQLLSQQRFFSDQAEELRREYEEFRSKYSLDFNLYDSSPSHILPKDPFQEYFDNMIECQRRVYDGYLSTSHLFTNRFFPLFRLLIQNAAGDWRDLIDFDTADPSQTSQNIVSLLERESDQKVEAAEFALVPKTEQKKSRKVGRKKVAPTTKKTPKQVLTKESSVTAQWTEGRKTSPAIDSLYHLKAQIDARIGLSPSSLPADLVAKPMSRSVKASANQSYALNMLALTTEMLQYPQCYDTSKFNHMGKTLVRFAALQASLACEQGMAAAILAEDPWKTLSHNQATFATILKRDPSHPAIKELGRETILYRFPKKEEVEREEVVREWPRWLEHSMQHIAPNQANNADLITLKKDSNPVAVQLTSDQAQKISTLESELQALSEAAQKMSGGCRGDKQTALVIIYKHLEAIKGFVQSLPFFCHQAFAVVPAQGIYLSAQTLLEHAWILSRVNQGQINVIATQIEENHFHQIASHIDSGELGRDLSAAEKSTLKLLHGVKAFEYLPGHCAERSEIGELQLLVSDLMGMAHAAGDTATTWGDKTKPRLETPEAVDARLKLFVDKTLVILNTVCKLVRPLVT